MTIERIICSDATTALSGLPDATCDCLVTSPPYWGLRNYDHPNQIGLEDDLDAYLKRLIEVFRAAKRVLKPDAVAWINIGDGYTSGNRAWRAPDKKNPARAMSVRPRTPSGLKPKDLIGLPWRVAFAMQNDGWFLRSDIIWHKPNAMPESVKDRPARDHEYIFMFTQNEKYFFDHEAIKERSGRNKRSVWSVNTKPFRGAHFATFPEELIEPCILAGSRKDGVILDPFFGSGTVGAVARQNGRGFIGIELNESYVQIAECRLNIRANFCGKLAAE